MSKCFICGSFYDYEYPYIGYRKLYELFYDFVLKHRIDTVYSCHRNAFDDIMEQICNSVKDSLGIKLIYVYEDRLISPPNGFVPYSISESISPLPSSPSLDTLYTSFYNWMIEQSEYMFTNIADDSDISQFVLQKAKQKGLKIFNIYDELPHKPEEYNMEWINGCVTNTAIYR